jgi:hypothetical protein
MALGIFDYPPKKITYTFDLSSHRSLALFFLHYYRKVVTVSETHQLFKTETLFCKMCL